MTKLQNILLTTIHLTDLISPKLAARLGVELLFRPRRTPRSKKEKKFWLSGEPILFSSGCEGRVFGSGKTKVWIVHGWMSRGSKMKNLIEACIESNCEVIVWDGPGHGDSPGNRTSLSPFTKILFNDINHSNKSPDAIIGHSFGGAASAYACQMGVTAKLLILIAAPSSCVGVFERYWNVLGLGNKAQKKFMEIVEAEIGIKVDSMSSVNFIEDIPQKILIIHDDIDKMVPISDALILQDIRSDVELIATTQLGHNRILHDTKTCGEVKNFLKTNLFS